MTGQAPVRRRASCDPGEGIPKSGTGLPAAVRLLCDAMLGRLARDLRLLGLDVALAGADLDDAQVAQQAQAEGRLLLTRDARLVEQAARAGLPHLSVGPADPAAQLAQAAAALGLRWDENTFLSRCSLCNEPLRPAPSDAPLPPGVEGPCSSCVRCGRLYWRGSHVRDLRERLRAALTGPGSSPAPSPPR